MEIELYSKLNNPIEAIDRIGEMFAKSGMFGCEKIEQGKILAMICLAEGKSPVAISKTYHIVEGNLSKKALAALAEFRSGGGKHKWLKSGDDIAAKEEDRYAELWLKDRDGNETTYRYSMADARLEGLIKPKSRWEKRPGNMLRARCISNGLGMLSPELFAGEDDSDRTPATTEPKPLLVSDDKPHAEAKTENLSNVVDIEVVPQSAPAPAPEKPEPKPEKPFTASDIASDASGRLTAETVAALESVIGADNAKAALSWLIERGWIKNNLTELSPDRAKRIFAKPAEFLGHVAKGGAK